jgi:hypothetical protein
MRWLPKSDRFLQRYARTPEPWVSLLVVGALIHLLVWGCVGELWYGRGED